MGRTNKGYILWQLRLHGYHIDEPRANRLSKEELLHIRAAAKFADAKVPKTQEDLKPHARIPRRQPKLEPRRRSRSPSNLKLSNVLDVIAPRFPN